MKQLIAIVALMFAATAMAQPAKQPEPKAPVKTEELNCVKKDKAGKCPPAPNSPKPTPKKKAEAK